MNCPQCGTPQSTVEKVTQDSLMNNSFTTRYRKCSNPKCELNTGKRAKLFKTTETAIKMIERK